MEGSLTDLSKYRLQSAMEDLSSAKLLYEAKQFKSSINRSYYTIFHCLRAVLALDGFDSSKHSGIISNFNANYVKTGIFDKAISKNIDTAYRLREKADYVDFFYRFRRRGSSAIRKSGDGVHIDKRLSSEQVEEQYLTQSQNRKQQKMPSPSTWHFFWRRHPDLNRG